MFALGLLSVILVTLCLGLWWSRAVEKAIRKGPRNGN